MSLLKKLVLSLRFVGILGVLRAVWYAIRVSVSGSRAVQVPPEPVRRPIRVLAFEETPVGGRFSFENGITLEVEVVHPGAVQLTWCPGTLPYTAFVFKEDQEVRILQEPIMAMRINKDSKTGSIASVVIETDAIALTIQSDGKAVLRRTDGAELLRTESPALRGDAWEISSPLSEDEHIYGLGQRASGLNLAGRRYEFWNSSPGGSYTEHADPLYLTAPVYMGLHHHGSYLVFFENTHKGFLDLTHQRATAGFAGGALRMHWMAGDPADLLERYTQLTGRPDLPPRWSLGFHQCRWGYQSDKDLRDVAAGFQAHDLPVQALHQDIDYMAGYRVFTVDPSRYPDLSALSAELAMRNIRLVTILDPGVRVDPTYPVYQSGAAQGAFARHPSAEIPATAPVWPGWCVFPDFIDPAARSWWEDQYPALLEHGVAGIWHDMNEPEVFAAWGDPALSPGVRHNFDGRQGTHLEARNIYGLFMNQAGYHALRKHHPDRRPWLLSRSGWAGSQRFAWHWTADIESSWTALRISVFMVVNLGLSGFAYTGTDIGGFSGNPDAELFTRWFQTAALHPFFRNHAARGTEPREPWVFGEPTTTIIRDSLRLRERLLPYIYTLAAVNAATGAPLVRPLFWRHPRQSDLWDAGDTFLLGDDLLVVPVFEPGQTERTFSAPPGNWYSFWTGERLPAARPAITAVRPERIPLYVRAGSILPLEAGPDALELHVYPDAGGGASGSLYFDAGDGYGPSGWAQIKLTGDASRVEVFQTGKAPFPWEQMTAVLHREKTAEPLPVKLS